jgi:hypothetical protein
VEKVFAPVLAKMAVLPPQQKGKRLQQSRKHHRMKHMLQK